MNDGRLKMKSTFILFGFLFVTRLALATDQQEGIFWVDSSRLQCSEGVLALRIHDAVSPYQSSFNFNFAYSKIGDQRECIERLLFMHDHFEGKVRTPIKLSKVRRGKRVPCDGCPGHQFRVRYYYVYNLTFSLGGLEFKSQVQPRRI